MWGALAMLVGASMLLLATGALAQLLDPAASAGLAAGLTASIFVVVGLFALLWGGAHVWVAMLTRRRRPAGRVLLLALAITNLLMLPFGTALGIYALWVLLTNDGRRLFETAAAGAVPKAGPAPPV